MPRTKPIICQTEESLVLLVYYNPTAQGNHAYVVGLPPDLTNAEKREILEMALTVVNNDLAKDLIPILSDDAPPNGEAIPAEDTPIVGNTELVYTPIEDELNGARSGHAPVLAQARRAVTRAKNGSRSPNKAKKAR